MVCYVGSFDETIATHLGLVTPFTYTSKVEFRPEEKQHDPATIVCSCGLGSGSQS